MLSPRLLILGTAICVHAADIHGTIVDADGGEHLARVRVELLGIQEYRTTTGSGGTFAFTAVVAGSYTLKIETVGYRLLKREISVANSDSQEYQMVLSPDTFRRSDSVQVHAGAFETGVVTSAPAELDLTGNELKNLGTVLMDDPLRAVAALPGVASNNDFQSHFTVRGAPFERVGFYLDDVLMHAPFHSVVAEDSNASLSILNGEMLDGMTLIPSAFPVEYADRTAAVLDGRTRDGSHTKPSIRIAAGVASSSVLAEGPFAHGRGSWLASVRKSYLQYLVSRATADSSVVIGFQDAQGKLAYNLTDRQTVSLYLLDGRTDLDRSRARQRSGINALINGGNRSSVAKAAWSYSPSDRFIASATGAWIRERFDSLNTAGQPLDAGSYGEWTGVGRVSWFWTPAHSIQLGWSARRIRDAGGENRFFNNANDIRQIDQHRGVAGRHGGFVEQSWSALGSALRGSVGLRIDTHDWYSGAAVSPVIGLSWRIAHGPELQVGWGQYVQYPELAWLGSPFGGRTLRPERANHAVVALEQPLGSDARIRAEVWNRDDRDLITRPFYDPRLVNGVVVIADNLRLFNSVRGYSRGVQLMIQRRSANRLSGWVGYTLSWARERDGVESTRYWAAEDQRHIANIYLSYRLRPTLHLSSRFSYASGEPVPAFVEARDGGFYLGTERNGARMPAYARLDFRANKSFTYDRWKLTVYGELINSTNHRNMRLVSFDGVNTRTRQTFFTFDRVFPIVPAGGVTLEF